MRLHITPSLGQIELHKLTPARVRAWLNAKQEEPSARGTPLAPRTVAYLHAILRAALADAQRDELTARNVATLVEPPAVRRPPVVPLTIEEASAVARATAGSRLAVLWLVLLSLGLRRGEALGLRWEDLDLEGGTVTLRRSLQRVRGDEPDPVTGRRSGALVERRLKTDASAASLALPESLREALQEHRKDQEAQRARARVWVDDGLVFTTSVGTPLEPRNVSRDWQNVLSRAGVRRVRLHDLRHSAASFMLAQGVHMKVVQATLRHSRMSTTADLYTHVLEDVQRAGAQQMDAFLRSLENEDGGQLLHTPLHGAAGGDNAGPP